MTGEAFSEEEIRAQTPATGRPREDMGESSHGQRPHRKPTLPTPRSPHLRASRSPCLGHPACGTWSGSPHRRTFALVYALPPLETLCPSQAGARREPGCFPGSPGVASPCLSAPHGGRLCQLLSGGRSSRNEGEDGHPHPKCQCPLLTRQLPAPPGSHVAFPGNAEMSQNQAVLDPA